MKGIIFNVLEDMVVEKLGMQAWNELMQQHAPNDRVYVSAKITMSTSCLPSRTAWQQN